MSLAPSRRRPSVLLPFLLFPFSLLLLPGVSFANAPPTAPVITEPLTDGRIVNAADVHMETAPFSDPDAGDTHACTDWEVWTIAPAERVWITACIGGLETTHTHLGDGVFENSHAGRADLIADTDYKLRVRHKDSSADAATEWSPWSERLFRTAPPVQPIPGQPGWIVRRPGYKVELVATGFQLPVNIAFAPNRGTHPSDPYFYVTELYGTIRVVFNDLTVGTYADNLLNYVPSGLFPGTGEQGLTGIVVDPATGDVFAAMLYRAGTVNYPKVVRFRSTDGGRTAAAQTTIRDMAGESQGQSHQISNLSLGPDGLLYCHMGDGFTAAAAQDLTSYRGKILRMNRDGTAPADNPFYNAASITARDYVYAYGVRNPFGGAWRAADGFLYAVENGPSTDRFAKIVRGTNYLWDGADSSMTNLAIYNWAPATGPVNLAFIQAATEGGSGFPAEMLDHAFVTESGSTYASGPGKRITEWTLTSAGALATGPTPFVEYNGTGKSSVAALAAGPDGLYFSDLYRESGATPTAAGANILRIKYYGAPTPGVVNDGPGADLDAQTEATSVAATWSGFSDPVNGLSRYAWAVGRAAGMSDVRAFTDTGLQTSASAAGLTLEDGQYFVTVRAVNGADMSIDVASDGVTVDTAAPETTLLGAPPPLTAAPTAAFTFDSADGWIAVAAGAIHTVVLAKDGAVWTWGGNNNGQLGDGTLTERRWPIRVPGQTGVSAVAAGRLHTLALLADGSVQAWGYNLFGQLGDGTTTQRTAPVPVPGLAGVTALAAGDLHTLALLADGTVRAWGDNGYGQLGDGTTTDRLSPATVPGLTGVIAIAAGGGHSLVLLADGTVRAWGNNGSGQLGDGTTTQRRTPVPLSGLTGVAAIAAGQYHSVALRSDGAVRAWGLNTNGQVGDGTTTQRPSPVAVSGVAGASAVAAGDTHTLALLADGTVRAWGGNLSGELGDGTTTARSAPVAVAGLAGITALDAGSFHSVALRAGAALQTSGANGNGQLGDATTTTSSNTPVAVRPVAAPVAFEESLDGAPFAPAASPRALAGLADGAHTYQVRAVDAAGNADATPASASWTVDASPPAAAGVNDGTGADVDAQTSTTTISANWPGWADPHSGIAAYAWAIGSTPGAADVQPFTDVGTAVSASNAGLSLTLDATYYVTVRATNGTGLASAATSDGLAIRSSIQIPVPLSPGYTLIALPLTPSTAYTAETLAQEINAQAGAAVCTAVLRYSGGAFQTHPVGTGIANFPIAVGEGYFVRCTQAGTWNVTGTPFAATTASLNLAAGYNLVALPLDADPANPYTADRAGVEAGATQVLRYVNGAFETHPVGTTVRDFPVVTGQGYFVRCATATAWTVRR